MAEGLDRLFKDCDQRIIITTFASNAHRIQNIINVAHRYGRKVAITGRSMENVIKVSSELGYLKVPPRTLVDISATGMNATDFAMDLLERERVIVVPGNAFGEGSSRYVRLSFATSDENIKKGIARIGAYMKRKLG